MKQKWTGKRMLIHACFDMFGDVKLPAIGWEKRSLYSNSDFTAMGLNLTNIQRQAIKIMQLKERRFLKNKIHM